MVPTTNFKFPNTIGNRVLFLILTLVFSAISVIFLYTFVAANTTAFRPIPSLDLALKFIAYPILVIIFFYLVYLKKNSNFNVAKLKDEMVREHRSKWTVKSIGVITVFFAPIMIVYLSYIYIGYIGNQLAIHSVSESVQVERARCSYSQHAYNRYLELDLLDHTNHKFSLNFPYSICENQPNIRNLNSKNIVIYGRSFVLGTVYDGFRYPRNLTQDTPQQTLPPPEDYIKTSEASVTKPIQDPSSLDYYKISPESKIYWHQ